jgi:hypothetical protein
MGSERTVGTRRQPSGPGLSFVIYERKTGTVKGIHHVVSGPAHADAVLTLVKQRAAAGRLNTAVIKHAALMAGVPQDRLAILRLSRPFEGSLAGLRVDRGRLSRGPRVRNGKLSPLISPRRRARR